MTSAIARVGALASAAHGRFDSALHDERVAARLGVWLGVLFTTCALTGAYSHVQQHPLAFPGVLPRPAGLYRVTQGLHVTAGFACIPVLLAKLWVVAPKLIQWPPARSVSHALERLLLLPLVGGGLFLLFSGVANVARWYPWTFSFPVAHLWTAWIAIGALVIHVGATAPITARLFRRREAAVADPSDRRRFLGGVAATSGLLGLGVVGGTVSWLSDLSFLAQRRAGVGPQGVPVNKTARGARVVEQATSPAYRLLVTGNVATRLSLSLDDLAALPQRTADLPIACVEGWSANATWTGVPVHALLAMAGAREGATVEVQSLQRRGGYRTAGLNSAQATDRDTLLALQLNGEPLDLDHGFPVRLIGPNRPGVMQTKWVGRLVVS